MENAKEPEKQEDIYGETLVEFGPRGKVKITERKSSEVNEPQEIEKTPGQIAYGKLNEFERRRVNDEMKKFEEKTPELFQKGWSIEEINEIRERLKKEWSEKMLALREENKK
jgi:hypothetical protein